MTALKLKFTRSQLASFLSDYESIKQFESLFATVEEISNDALIEINIAINVVGAKAQQALDGLDEVDGAVSRLEAERRAFIEPEPVDQLRSPVGIAIEELQDVQISLPLAGDAIKYDAVRKIWRNMP